MVKLLTEDEYIALWLEEAEEDPECDDTPEEVTAYAKANYEEYVEGYYDDYHWLIQGHDYIKWFIDGCESFEEIAETLEAHAESYRSLSHDHVLAEPVSDGRIIFDRKDGRWVYTEDEKGSLSLAKYED